MRIKERALRILRLERVEREILAVLEEIGDTASHCESLSYRIAFTQGTERFKIRHREKMQQHRLKLLYRMFDEKTERYAALRA